MTTYRSLNSVPVVPGDARPTTWVSQQVGDLTIVIKAERPDDLDAALSMTGVIRAIEKGPQSHAERRSRGWRVPVWAMACIVFGSPLMVLGLFANRPVSAAIHWWLST